MRFKLRLTRALLIFLLTSILFSSFIILVYSQRSRTFPTTVPTPQHSSSIIPAPLVFGVALLDRPPPLNQSTRMEIYNFVKANPGIHFRGICNGLNLSVGVAQYHLGLLTKAGLISFFPYGRYKRYFASKKLTKREMTIISLIRRRTTGQILKILLEKTQTSHGDLSSQLSISSQALTWQMNHLRKEGIVHEVKDGIKTVYSLEKTITPILQQYIAYVGKDRI